MTVETTAPQRDYDPAVDLAKMGVFLRAERKRQKLSRAKVCAVAKVTPSTLQEIEAGTGNPEVRTLSRLSEALGLELWEVVRQSSEKAKVADEMTSPDNQSRDTVRAIPPQPGEEPDGSTVVSGFGISDAQDAKLLKSLAFTIIRAANALRDHGAVRSDDAGTPEGRDEPADRRGSDDAPGLSRVK